MNRVGIGGKGESVWLGWFLIDVLNRFAALCDAGANQPTLGSSRRLSADDCAAAIEAYGWDGEWYLRGILR